MCGTCRRQAQPYKNPLTAFNSRARLDSVNRTPAILSRVGQSSDESSSNAMKAQAGMQLAIRCSLSEHPGAIPQPACQGTGVGCTALGWGVGNGLYCNVLNSKMQ